ncbi:hypothetical protein F0562_034319 [Nyssa sinensis]|uniref:Uncharacterized protein n=1 Tax=Nyssa sinensis TaxID=561372 RepID=A0A5J5AKC2_9ASTE|nr:hypothetical protein F0562_034319 [Nyssa sinensis]
MEVLKQRKEKLDGGESSNKTNMENSMLAAVEVREIGSTLELNLVTGLDKRVMLHEVLHVLEAEGTAEVVSASYSNVGDKIFYTIHSQVHELR